jgi:hypothetical protein
MVARGGGGNLVLLLDVSVMNRDAGDHKGPPFPASSTLAPTDIDGLFLGLMRIRAEEPMIGR